MIIFTKLKLLIWTLHLYFINVIYYFLAVQLILLSFVIQIFGKKLFLAAANWYADMYLLLLRIAVGSKFEIQGQENIESVKDKPCIIVGNHQSMLETMFWIDKYFKDVWYIMKEEIRRVPLYGKILERHSGILIDRSPRSLKEIYNLADRVFPNNGQIVIFPQGSRMPVDEPIKFKAGFISVYKKYNVPIVPMVVTTGCIWGKGYKRYPGKAVMKFLPPIEPGLDKDVIMERVTSAIQKEYDKLIAENPCVPCQK